MTLKISIANAITGETVEREMTADELTAYEADSARRAKINADNDKAKGEAAAKKTAAEAKLLDLGLTTDDLRALGL
jgi:hypothetical protein